MSLRMLKLQDSLAIEKVMPRQKQIEASEVFAQHPDFCVVKLSVERRNRIGGQHRRQTGNSTGSCGLTFASSSIVLFGEGTRACSLRSST